jgi:trans-aconitate 2-methyltransferase
MAQRYAFGDNDQAARRLVQVAAIFAPPTRAFLHVAARRSVGLAVDLGCGPGHTTRLLARCVRPGRLAGLDQSAAFLAKARRRVPAADFYVQDVTRTPFPTGLADLLFARFLLSHLQDPGQAVASWATQLVPAGLLLLDEVEWIRTDDPALATYLRILAAVLEARGHRLEAGPLLDALPDPPGTVRRTSRVVVHPVDPQRAAAMFRNNLAVWRHDPRARDLADAPTLDRLDQALAGRMLDPITWGLRQIAYERMPAADVAGAPVRPG